MMQVATPPDWHQTVDWPLFRDNHSRMPMQCTAMCGVYIYVSIQEAYMPALLLAACLDCPDTLTECCLRNWCHRVRSAITRRTVLTYNHSRSAGCEATHTWSHGYNWWLVLQV